MFKDLKTGEDHTAKWQTIISGIISLVVLVLVGLGRLDPMFVGILVLPLLGIGSMASKNKKEKEG